MSEADFIPSKAQRKVDLAIDRFVEWVNQSPREQLGAEDVPEFLRLGPPPSGVFDSVSWRIVRAPSPCAWVKDFEAKLPGSLPGSYRSLVTRYLFPTFDAGVVRLFANTGAGFHDELVEAVFRDESLYRALHGAGLVQFGRPATGVYDPVCFDLNRMTGAGECPVIQVDHEAIFIHGRVQVVAELASSFLTLVAA